MGPASPVVDLRDLVAGYEPGVPVLSGVDLAVGAGEVVGVLGGSGSGKTTLLNVILGFLRPWRGYGRVCGRDLFDPGLRPWNHLRDIGVIFQGGALFDSLSVWENVAYGIAEDPGWSPSEMEAKVEEHLRFLGIEGLAGRYPSEISGGQARRVSVARSLILNPTLMLYDEPFSGLDPVTALQVGDAIRRVGGAGVSSILVSHRVEHVARVSDRTVLLREGRIAFDGPPRDLFDTGDPLVEAFLAACGGISPWRRQLHP